MKAIKLFTLAILVIPFLSCSKDGENVPPTPIEGEETYSAVTISFPKTMMSRAADPNAANAVESKVTTVAVYVVDNGTGTMHKGVFGSGQFTSSGDVYTLTSAIKTTTGEKKVYVVLNPSTAIQTAIETMRGAAFGENAINGTVENDFVTPSDLVMSSVVATPTTLAIQTEAEAIASPLAINVQRNTAKIAVKEKVENTPVVGGSVSDLKFALLVEPKKSYLIQQIENPSNTVKTPGQNISTLTPENEYFTKVATPTTWKELNKNSIENNALEGFYALENVNTVNLVGNTTAAIIKAVYTPTAGTVVVAYAADGTRTMGSISTDKSFYVKKSDNTIWSEAGYADALANGFTADHFSKKYENGVTYYRIWVQDSAGKRGVLRNTYYVLNITKISGVGLPYVPGVDPEDPNNPEDPNLPIEEDTYVSVEVTILPWNVESSDHEI